jgi:hypothetical protein
MPLSLFWMIKFWLLIWKLITLLWWLICSMLPPSNCIMFYCQASGNVCVARELHRNGLAYELLEKSKSVARNWGKKQSTAKWTLLLLFSLPWKWSIYAHFFKCHCHYQLDSIREFNCTWKCWSCAFKRIWYLVVELD